jgi:hypothetical protein
VVPPPDGADTALTEGTIRISDECVILEARRGPVLLIWPADRTTWGAAAKAVAFDNYESSGDPESGKTVTVTDGMRVALGGSGGTRDDGETPEEWLADREWVMRPAASCVVDEWWSVGAMTR